MDNLIKIILIIFVIFLLLNYSCGKKEDFGNKSQAYDLNNCDTKCKKNKIFSNKISKKICKGNKECIKGLQKLKFCKSNGKNEICPDYSDKYIIYTYNDCNQKKNKNKKICKCTKPKSNCYLKLDKCKNDKNSEDYVTTKDGDEDYDICKVGQNDLYSMREEDDENIKLFNLVNKIINKKGKSKKRKQMSEENCLKCYNKKTCETIDNISRSKGRTHKSKARKKLLNLIINTCPKKCRKLSKKKIKESLIHLNDCDLIKNEKTYSNLFGNSMITQNSVTAATAPETSEKTTPARVKLDHNPNLKYFALFTRDFATVLNDDYSFKDLQFDSKGILSQSEKYILKDCNSNWCNAARGHSEYEWKLYNGKYLLKDYDNYDTAHIPTKYEKDFYIDLNKKITYKGYDYYIGKSLKGVYITKDMFLFITTRPAEDFLTKDKIFGKRRLRIEEIIKPLYYELNKTNPSEKALDDILSRIDK